MNSNERLDEMQKRIDALEQWKTSCTMLMAGWGGICMAVLTAGGIIVTYYQDIKAYLMALWAVK